MRRRQEPWMIFVKPGDVLKTPSGDYRVIRKLSRYPDGDLRSAYFAIRRCSWTKRGYTVKQASELFGWEFVAARDLPKTRLDLALASCIIHHNGPQISCCDVESLA